jgi:methionyl aminopeptidase
LKVIKNLCGHGVGRSLHEEPDELLNYKNRFDTRRFKKNSVVAIETFIADSNLAVELEDGWTMVGNKGGYDGAARAYDRCYGWKANHFNQDE